MIGFIEHQDPWVFQDDARQGNALSLTGLADHIEAFQLGMATQLLEHSRQVLDDQTEDLEVVEEGHRACGILP